MRWQENDRVDTREGNGRDGAKIFNKRGRNVVEFIYPFLLINVCKVGLREYLTTANL